MNRTIGHRWSRDVCLSFVLWWGISRISNVWIGAAVDRLVRRLSWREIIRTRQSGPARTAQFLWRLGRGRQARRAGLGEGYAMTHFKTCRGWERGGCGRRRDGRSRMHTILVTSFTVRCLYVLCSLTLFMFNLAFHINHLILSVLHIRPMFCTLSNRHYLNSHGGFKSSWAPNFKGSYSFLKHPFRNYGMGIFNATCDISTILKLFEFNDQLNALHVHLSDVLCGIQLQIHWKFHSLFRFPMKFWIRNSELDKRLWIGKSPMYKHPSQNWKEAYSDPLFRWIKFVVLLESQLKNFRQWRERLLNFLSYGQQ